MEITPWNVALGTARSMGMFSQMEPEGPGPGLIGTLLERPYAWKKVLDEEMQPKPLVKVRRPQPPLRHPLALKEPITRIPSYMAPVARPSAYPAQAIPESKPSAPPNRTSAIHVEEPWEEAVTPPDRPLPVLNREGMRLLGTIRSIRRIHTESPGEVVPCPALIKYIEDMRAYRLAHEGEDIPSEEEMDRAAILAAS